MMNQAQKLRYYCDLTEQTAGEVVAKRGRWMSFLDSAALMYKYSFSDQLLIHAQRPEAIACAPIETWNTTFKRWVQPGTKGIALIDDTGTRPKLKYVYDVNDTHTYGKAAPVVGIWELREEHKNLVLTELAKIYDDVDNGSISETFNNIAIHMAAEYYDDNATEIRYRTEGSLLEELDGDNLRAAFVDAVAGSMAYLMMKRCGFDTEEYFTEDDFDHISSFNTPDIIHSLGEATSDLSQQVLRDVELVVKKYERQKANEIAMNQERSSVAEPVQAQELTQTQQLNPNIETERNVVNERTNTTIPTSTESQRADNSGEIRDGIRPSGGLPSAQHPTERGHGRETAGQVRHDEEILLEEQPQDNLRSDAVTGEAVPPLQGSGGTGGSTAVQSNGHDSGENGTAGQGTRPDGMDSGNERSQSPSGGTGTPRTDLRRNLGDYETPGQSLYQFGINLEQGTESLSQVGITPEQGANNLVKGVQASGQEPPLFSENLKTAFSTSSIIPDEVDSILRDGGNDRKNSIQRIVAHFAKDLPLESNAHYLRDEYLRGRYKYQRVAEGGKGFQFGNKKFSVWWNEDGIKIGRGESALFAEDYAFITWEQAAGRIGQLYSSGHFVNHDVLEEALNNEYKHAAGNRREASQKQTAEGGLNKNSPEFLRGLRGEYP